MRRIRLPHCRLSGTSRVACWIATAVLLLLPACGGGGGGGGGGTTTAPGLNLTGTWSGSAQDSSGPGSVTWRITQNGNSVSGTLRFTDSSSGISGRGTVTGTLAGSRLSFVMEIPVGGFGSPFKSCSFKTDSGSAQATTSRIQGTYSGTNSCTGPVRNGSIDLSR